MQYAKITVPQLAAGELRVFDSRTGATDASDAVLCHGTSQRARYITSHPSSHSAAESARTAAITAQMRAAAAGSTDASNTITESQARTALRSAASALRSAASALRSVATALTNADLSPTAATSAADAAYTTDTTDTDHATTATTAADASTNDLSALKDSLTTAAGNLTSAADALRDAASALHNADAVSRVFQLRAEIMPGDQEYILVTNADLDQNETLAVQFHGAIAADIVQREGSLNAGDQDPYAITVTEPGLLTVETTGSTDTKGRLTGTEDMVDAPANAGGSGNNFKIAVPVTGEGDGAYTVFVSGQTPNYDRGLHLKHGLQSRYAG